MSSMTFKRMGFSSRASNVSQRLRTYASSSLLSSQTHLIFGANTDVGKTVVSAGLIRASLVTGNTTHYIKPLQCGGSDERFIIRYAPNTTSSTTLYEWETPVSPHYASRLEQYPVSDEQVLTSLRDCLDGLKGASHVWVETAGGVLSPSSSSPDNSSPRHAHDKSGWGWVTQADLYRPLIERSSVVMIGDGRLGGISSTLSSLESLLVRGYNVSGVILLESGYDNQEAIQEYASRNFEHAGSSSSIFHNPEASIVSLPSLPPQPEPLLDWYNMEIVQKKLESFVQDHLTQAWEEREIM